jgi:hypothetical protein
MAESRVKAPEPKSTGKKKILRPTKSKAQATEDPHIEFKTSDHSWCCSSRLGASIEEEELKKGDATVSLSESAEFASSFKSSGTKKPAFSPTDNGMIYSFGFNEGVRPYFEDRHRYCHRLWPGKNPLGECVDVIRRSC